MLYLKLQWTLLLFLSIASKGVAQFEFKNTGEISHYDEQIWSIEGGESQLFVAGDKSVLYQESINWFKKMLESNNENVVLNVYDNYIRIRSQFTMYYLFTKNSLKSLPISFEFDLNFVNNTVIMRIVSFETNYPKENLDLFFANRSLMKFRPYKIGIGRKVKRTKELNQMLRVQELINKYYYSLEEFMTR